ncbi:TetR/AcrR family transcriptional regulator [Gordonia sp. CPCC 206044]|uniref:TetR/AcrR family transcriptional regulator n=1 Tax=Gordonia sp. CPCC 206044 TaxID=3140793 RepID=UPI003AF34C7E
MAGPASRPGSTPTRRREHTRQRLIDASFRVFAEKGFGATRIDDVCRASGYTKGAFYSNFSSLEELFFDLYRQQSADATDRLVEVALHGAERDLVTLASDWIHALDVSREWLLVNIDFVLYAARRPQAAEGLRGSRAALRDAAQKRIAALIADDGMDLPAPFTTPADLARAVVTIYDGVIYQLLLDMDLDTVRQHFVDIISALATPVPTGEATDRGSA